MVLLSCTAGPHDVDDDDYDDIIRYVISGIKYQILHIKYHISNIEFHPRQVLMMMEIKYHISCQDH